MPESVVDLRSDTVTRPTLAMREAMFQAEVGDDVLDHDPTTLALEARVAELLGKERALFFPSGVQANQTALAVQGQRGTEVILEAGAHIFNYEEAAGAVLSGLQLRPVPTPDGLLSAEIVRDAIRPPSPYMHATSLIALENTHNSAGGKILPWTPSWRSGRSRPKPVSPCTWTVPASGTLAWRRVCGPPSTPPGPTR